jgi:hypothetical protein
MITGYREQFYWWEIVNFARKLVMVIVYAASFEDLRSHYVSSPSNFLSNNSESIQFSVE